MKLEINIRNVKIHVNIDTLIFLTTRNKSLACLQGNGEYITAEYFFSFVGILRKNRLKTAYHFTGEIDPNCDCIFLSITS